MESRGAVGQCERAWRKFLFKPERRDAHAGGWRVEVPTVTDEPMRGDEEGAGVVEDGGSGVKPRLLKNHAGEIGMGGGDFECEVRAEALADEKDGAGGCVARAGEVLEGPFGVLPPAVLAGVDESALAVAAVVDGEDGEAGGVEAMEIVEGVAEIAGCAVEIERGVAGEGRAGRGGNPPAGEARDAGLSGGEADGVECEADDGGSAGDLGRGVVKELPIALPEDEAQGDPGEDEAADDDRAEHGD